ncbi:MAG: hypothetical protein IT215_09430, partial [Chitinophagaceae bacterium]|nr:hypothetical protein [Chitinophagaceae bacterium]
MDLKDENNFKQEIILLPEKVDESLFKDIALNMSDSFVMDKDQLDLVLSMFGIPSIENLLNVVSNFFLTKVQLKKITIDSVQKINSKRLIADFIKETGLTRPKFENEHEREIVKNVFFKLGRLYLHEALFPELIEANPRLAYSVLNFLKRTITEIAIAE